jgi:hypothetical protein
MRNAVEEDGEAVGMLCSEVKFHEFEARKPQYGQFRL